MGEPKSGISGGLPSFRYVGDEDLERLHETALEILRDPGIRVLTAAARTVLLDHGATLTGEDLVSIPAELVERALASAPERFSIFDRAGQEALRLGEGSAYLGAGVTCLYYLDQ